MKNQKGITLIALVVTIVVLLILAGVAIAMLRGDNGILTKATKAASATDIAEAKEAVSNRINELTTAWYDGTYNTKTETVDLGAYIKTELAKTDSKIDGYLLTSGGKDTSDDNVIILKLKYDNIYAIYYANNVTAEKTVNGTTVKAASAGQLVWSDEK